MFYKKKRKYKIQNILYLTLFLEGKFMEYVILIIILILVLIALKIGLNIKIKDVKKIKKIAYSEENNKLIKKIPTNKQMCREMLEMLENEDVIIEDTQDEKSKKSLYLVMQNKIIIANIDNTFTRIQTIAHECIHSIQDKIMLKSNFILSNINMLYFLTISIITIVCNLNTNIQNLLLAILIALQLILFVIRNSLEVDAMTRAEGIAKEYIKQNLTEEETTKIIRKYKELNNIGIKLYTYMLVAKAIVKPIIYCLILIIF